MRHLEAQLGKHTSMNAKLRAALFENAEALAKTEAARASAATAVTRLQVGRYVRRVLEYVGVMRAFFGGCCHQK